MDKVNFEILKGTKDYVGLDAKIKEKLFSTLKEEFMKNGFRPFQTPHIEYIDTLANKYDEDAEIVQEIFKVSDRGERALGLRYDLTIPLCRYLAQNIKSMKLPFRRFHIGSAFRDGPIKTGRLREFEQCDCDIVGLKDVNCEIELMELFYRCYTKLNIDTIIELNSNKILKGALKQYNFSEEDLDKLVLSIDKLKKIGIEGVLSEIKENGFNTEDVKLAIEILQSKTFEEIKSKAIHEKLLEGIEELETLVNGCSRLLIPIRVNFTMSRGHSYYTGNIWEVYDIKDRVKSSIGAGGRYDKGISNYIGSNEEIPAVGISFGVVGMMEILTKQMKDESIGVSDVLVVGLDSSLIVDCNTIANKIRNEENKNVELYYGKLKKAFDYCSSLGIKEIIVFGLKDKEAGMFKIKNLDSGDEREIKIT